MPFHRVQFDFEVMPKALATSGAKYGWSEAWYDTVDQTDAAARAQALNVAFIRRYFLTPGWRIAGLRISQWSPEEGLSRHASHYFLPPDTGVGTWDVPNDDEQPYDALVCSANTAGGLTRPRDFRGIPNSIINAGGIFVADFRFTNYFGIFTRFITGAFVPNVFPDTATAPQYGFRVRSKSGEFDLLKLLIAPQIGPPNIPGASPIRPVIVVRGNPSIFGGQTLVISGAVGTAGLNGTWVAKDGSAPYDDLAGSFYIQLRQKRRGRAVQGVPTAGKVSVFTYSLDRLVTMTPGYGNSRQTGRPSRLPRGRRSAAS